MDKKIHLIRHCFTLAVLMIAIAVSGVFVSCGGGYQNATISADGQSLVDTRCQLPKVHRCRDVKVPRKKYTKTFYLFSNKRPKKEYKIVYVTENVCGCVESSSIFR